MNKLGVKYLSINGWESEFFHTDECLKITYDEYIELMEKYGAVKEDKNYHAGRDDYYFTIREQIQKFIDEIVGLLLILTMITEG